MIKRFKNIKINRLIAHLIVTLLYPSDDGCPIRSISYDPSHDGRDVTVHTDCGVWTFTEP